MIEMMETFFKITEGYMHVCLQRFTIILVYALENTK